MYTPRKNRSNSLPIIVRIFKKKCRNCNNHLLKNERCPCIDDIYPNKIEVKRSVKRIMSQPIIEISNDNN